ncbi:hypothetical protein DIZ81_00290 [Legionella taurinensis]|uniref:Uncharacterized protein n=1 Tax=Legionella taurinensis TaxID=70611 RepID=A0A3A5LHY6_9GAMM|nr:hypothetical protein [Legionella taurinensis]MDX1836688.1 hypothetical protein [Legionella taurinensis]PUT42857.1 hypothetical protein DB744_00290 [Legionella taurinensis]PUT45412.1 hypothetical protein DB746_00290 [Legionella taurinensis]PUT47013.1 hypothetical protein DB743_03710 [Legionella taurinensis]PUT49179.1 hypothetical protein DB745_00290 [Legionella taurinensis]
MHSPTVEDRIIHLLKHSGAGFKLANDENGTFLKSKLFADEEAAREILAEINSKMQLTFIEVEADPGGSGWYITYNASPVVKNHFGSEEIAEERQPKL